MAYCVGGQIEFSPEGGDITVRDMFILGRGVNHGPAAFHVGREAVDGTAEIKIRVAMRPLEERYARFNARLLAAQARHKAQASSNPFR